MLLQGQIYSTWWFVMGLQLRSSLEEAIPRMKKERLEVPPSWISAVETFAGEVTLWRFSDSQTLRCFLLCLYFLLLSWLFVSCLLKGWWSSRPWGTRKGRYLDKQVWSCATPSICFWEAELPRLHSNEVLEAVEAWRYTYWRPENTRSEFVS